MRLYTFDCIVFNGENLFHKPLSSRYGVRPSRPLSRSSLRD